MEYEMGMKVVKDLHKQGIYFATGNLTNFDDEYDKIVAKIIEESAGIQELLRTLKYARSGIKNKWTDVDLIDSVIKKYDVE